MKKLLTKMESGFCKLVAAWWYGLALYGLAASGRCHRHMHPEQDV